MGRKRAIAIYLALMCAFVGHSQPFESLNDKFPFPRARCVFQDSYGFLWFGTIDGLVRYDGISTRVFRNSPSDSASLPGQEIHAIIEMSDTTLLLGFQDRGLALFNRKSYSSELVPLAESGKRITVNCMIKDRSSIVWVATNNGLFSLEGDDVTHYKADPTDAQGLLNPIVLQVYEDRHLNLWVGTREGMHLLDRETGKFENPGTNATFPDQLIIDIDEDLHGKLWASLRLGPNRLYTWDQENAVFIADERFARDGEFRIDFDSDNALWISSRGRGLYRVTEDSEVFYDPYENWKHGFWGLGVFDVLHDKYRNTWVLGEEVFVKSGDGKNFNSIVVNNYVVHSVYADDQYIWYCADDPLRWNRETGKVERFLEGFPMKELRNPVALKSQTRIRHFEEWGEDLVMSTTRNMVLWDRNRDEYTDLPTTAGGPLRDFVIDPDGNAWVAVNQQLPMRMKLPSGEVERLKVLGEASTTHAVARSEDGMQWWGTRTKGLFSFHPETQEVVHYAPDPEQPLSSLSSFTIHDVLCHSDGSVWVGTKFGLDVIESGNQPGKACPSGCREYQYPDYICPGR